MDRQSGAPCPVEVTPTSGGGRSPPPLYRSYTEKVPQPLVDQDRTASRVPARANDCDQLL